MSGKSYAVDAVEEGLAPFDGIAIAGFSFYKEESLDEEITKLGMILEREEQAEVYIDWKNSKKQEISDAVSDLDRPLVYFESTQPKGLGELKTNGASADIDRSISLAGGINAFGSSEDETVTTSWESVIAKKPDVIFQAKSDNVLGWDAFPSVNTTAAQQVRDEILTRTGGSAVPAIEDDSVWILYRKMLYGPGSVIGSAYMAKLIHPEIDLDPVQIYSEYLDLIGVDMPEDRTFVFPDL